ncbi:hypothetical protein ATANTOWER_024479 [Ataeniobius toweri]|uniref:Uncharacterized protein n=1 Tax=Ataeniobius toweri TaxID=208326 RepID=A0ABU7AB49_9TELE|nr:hypothetical protein [Ataeniobius toweri]
MTLPGLWKWFSPAAGCNQALFSVSRWFHMFQYILIHHFSQRESEVGRCYQRRKEDKEVISFFLQNSDITMMLFMCILWSHLEDISWTMSCTHAADYDSSGDRKTCPVQYLQCFHCEVCYILVLAKIRFRILSLLFDFPQCDKISLVAWLRISNLHQICYLC